MKTILSTKKLTFSQKEHLLNAKLAVIDLDFITTQEVNFKIPEGTRHPIENAIFTSQKAVRVVFENTIKIENVYCVGKRTEKLVKEKSMVIKYSASNAKELSRYIIKEAPDKIFHYFCAKGRLNTLPDVLTSNKVKWFEIPVYKTLFKPKEYKQQFNGVLFFSPSGVESYFSINNQPEHSFCIGNTTAKALKKYTNNYTVATQPAVENVLIKAIKHFKND